MSKKSVASFEKNLEALEVIVNKLEKGELSLDESLKHFEHGIKLARLCQTSLSEAQQKVEILMQQTENAEAEKFQIFNDEDH